ncbi:response regulator [Leptospira biflexa]|jgi:two-component system chemotaxis response regulator CheY|uniref:Chemotactic two-component response regulator protein CheY n=1 Tax=Leptospira biflexa serovar Patoc (strain Patoc 1 / ATCC 23582 / Paris) TaxID=456481 RepID=B0SLY9_LEPBP|nr:response regulator [Leptospira biflexa]ABZ93415.1 Response regulator receiver domain [Leptospira biflexa serovar Patoc strain 'Patoc 1 (Ames)']ABZ97041.1 Chemotactic two-component response regulator protein CheY [Leptospira biflexa serovar Patoc strain 'Patoc 1 (Paris)']TGM35267.1 response regulator [Leptospira biflexa]TGM38298.1 response regulator [Leptospira biflexa]TGM47834.1 response regulator [Leptospira biflexa]
MAKILTVDDAPAVLKILNLVLTTDGHEVESASNGMEALEKIQNTKFDIGIFDVNMPGMTGIELTEKALKSDNGKTMKIVMLTTESSEEMKNKGKAAGAVGWLVKPFANESLAKLISQLI